MQTADFPPPAGTPVQLTPDLRLILAPNPSPMTYWGTNTYLLGHDEIAVIDPGPDDDAHLAAILRAGGDNITHIIVTHAHLDHSPLAKRLGLATGAPVYGFGPATAGRSAVMKQLVAHGMRVTGEGIDHGFHPDITLADGDVITTPNWALTALHTPGHIGNHLCLTWGDAMFTGDHVMGWASSLVSPPDGDLTDFMASCDRLRRVPSAIYYPAHGAPVTDPAARLDWLIAHRKTREAQIITALGAGAQSIASLTATLYAGVAPALIPAASRNVFAHLIDLHQRGILTASPTLSETANFQLSN